MEVGQFVQLCDVIPVGVCKPGGTWVIHLAFTIQDLGRGVRERRKALTQTIPKDMFCFFFQGEKAKTSIS